MGCCHSTSNDFSNQEDYIPQNDTNNVGNSNKQSEKVPPIVITKAHSVASVDSCPPPSTSAHVQHASDTKHSEQFDKDRSENGSETNTFEKPPVIIEERTQKHEFGAPPDLLEQRTDHQASIRPVKPIVINTPETSDEPSIVPASHIPQAKAAATEAGILSPSSTETTSTMPEPTSTSWSIIIRHNLSLSKDTVVEIPVTEPFIKVSDIKSTIHLKPGLHVKLIHLGKILQDSSVLVPSSCSKSQTSKNNTIKIANGAVIQAMIY
ncbi:hypothetical protein [Parasitella parasitica]|uniref:Ubiquitin-like domain-containing protein n=1 Tax=Parasitella parasitica TaxID=35722 RepID=A0A0B7NI27_9FUNG|nr:hypothetical protein [Parasitella parasitica]